MCHQFFLPFATQDYHFVSRHGGSVARRQSFDEYYCTYLLCHGNNKSSATGSMTRKLLHKKCYISHRYMILWNEPCVPLLQHNSHCDNHDTIIHTLITCRIEVWMESLTDCWSLARSTWCVRTRVSRCSIFRLRLKKAKSVFHPWRHPSSPQSDF